MVKSYQELIKIKEAQGGLAVAFGCFDILHYGHLNFFEKVSKLTTCPIAIGVLPDEYVRITKGEGRPINNEATRLKSVDEALKNKYTFLVSEKGEFNFYKDKFNLEGGEVLWCYPINALYKIKPTEFYYSTDFPLTEDIKKVFEELNLKHQAVPYTEGISSTEIINHLK